MAAVGAELSGFWFPSSGPAGFFILLILLLVFLMSLCSDCNRRSFELKDPEVDRNPSSLIRVVKLEEGRENPMIDEIQNDEKEFGPEGGFIPWRSHLGAPQSQTESRPEEETSVSLPPWRSHLVAPQSHNSAHVYDVINGGRSSSNDASSLTANQSGDPDIPPAADLNSVYARVGKKTNVSDSPAGLPGDSPGSLPGDSPGGLPGDSPGGLPGDSPGGLPGDSPGGLPGDSPGSLPGDSPGGLPGDSPEEAKGREEEEEPKPPLPDRRTDMD